MFRKKFSSSRTILKWWNTIMAILYLSKPVKLQIFFVLVIIHTYLHSYLKALKAATGDVLEKRYFPKFRGKHLYQSPATLFKKRLWHRPANFAKSLRLSFS